MAHRLPPRIPRPAPNPPSPLHPPRLLIAGGTVPRANPHPGPGHHPLPEARARDPVRAPLLGRHHARRQPAQELGPLLAPGWRQPGLLDLPPPIPRRCYYYYYFGILIIIILKNPLLLLPHIPRPRPLFRRRTRQSVHPPGAAQPAQQRRRRHRARHPARLGLRARHVPQLHV